MTRRARITVADVSRVIKAARNAGMTVGAIEVSPDGTIRVAESDKAVKDSPLQTWLRETADASRKAG